MYTTATFRNNLTIEGLNPLRVACVAALKAKGERGNWVHESTKGRARRGKMEKEAKGCRFQHPRAPEFLLPAMQAAPLIKTLHSNYRMSSEYTPHCQALN